MSREQRNPRRFYNHPPFFFSPVIAHAQLQPAHARTGPQHSAAKHRLQSPCSRHAMGRKSLHGSRQAQRERRER